MPSSPSLLVLAVGVLGFALPAVTRAQDAAPAVDGAVPAADAAPVWAPQTADTWLDTWLVDVNRYGARYHDAFVDELVRYQGAPRVLVEELLVDQRWRPADVYVACATALAIGRPCREVAGAFRRDTTDGWADVLAQFDVTPESAQLRRVREGMVLSYDRWARPIALDAALQRAFPDREGH